MGRRVKGVEREEKGMLVEWAGLDLRCTVPLVERLTLYQKKVHQK